MRKLLVLTLAASTLALFTAVPSTAFNPGECDAGQNQKSLGQGDDVWDGNDSPNCTDGQGGNDHLYGNGGGDNLYGRAGLDEVHGGGAADYIDGGDDPDFVYGDSGNDIILGGAQNDTIYDGTGGNGDAIDGGNGYDILKHCTGAGSDSGLDSWVNIEQVDAGNQYC